MMIIQAMGLKRKLRAYKVLLLGCFGAENKSYNEILYLILWKQGKLTSLDELNAVWSNSAPDKKR